jgi:hypothetical protein
VTNVATYDIFKNSGNIVKKSCGLTFTNRRTFVIFKSGTAYVHKLGKVRKSILRLAKTKNKPENGTEISEKPFITKLNILTSLISMDAAVL